MNNTIVSLITPPLNGAVSVIRISGDDSLRIINDIFSNKKIEPNKVVYGKILSGKEVIDQVLVTFFKGPRSFTGEDVIEISCHGSMLIVNQIIALIISKGARLAQRGEFSSRAYYNGKIDLVQAEAINSMINATTVEAKKLALYSLEGETSTLLKPLLNKLADILSNIEVNIDYPEYQDIEEVTTDKILIECKEMIETVDNLLRQSQKSKIIMHGINVALVGLPNTGKSSLLNALLQKEKAIVSDIPGTTRDVVEGNISLNGLPLHLLDTAGIHDSDNLVESLGIKKSQQIINDADLVIMVKDATSVTSKQEQEIYQSIKDKKHIIVYNKADKLKEKEDGKLYISALNNDVEKLKEEILKQFDLSSNDIVPSLCNTRQIGLLERARENFIKAREEASYNLPLDLVVVHIKEGYDLLKEILGLTVRVDLEEEIFSRFCVGK